MANWNFSQKFRPLTAQPASLLQQKSGYYEIAAPKQVQDQIACFWFQTIEPSFMFEPKWIIPDLCRDFIIQIDLFSGEILNYCWTELDVSPYESSFGVGSQQPSLLVGIRFFFWTVPCFPIFQNIQSPVFQKNFLTNLQPFFCRSTHVKTILPVIVKQLQKNYQPEIMPATMLNTLDGLLTQKGNLKIRALPEIAGLSNRQVERLFQQYFAKTPKQLANLIRYQYLWRNLICQPNFNVQDAVFDYGFTHQSHLITSFKSFHGMTPAQAQLHYWKHASKFMPSHEISKKGITGSA